MEHLTKYTMYAPIIDALVQVATTTEPSAIVKILKLLKQLRDSIKHTADQEAALET
jgi:flagellin-specific chaperone FliS